ncbi:MAG: hypothetical protein MUE78_12635 [Ilumatobacteraceae bacterium]|jgi:hypothetical protein|nr:hypothetical protein [Ilumatobacteraceae bacterium]
MSERTLSRRAIELVAVALLGLATVGSAWCAFQASEWNDQQTLAIRDSNQATIKQSAAYSLGAQKVSYDATVIASYAEALFDDDQQRIDLYRELLIRPDLVPFLEQWQAQAQAGDQPPNLFENEEYLTAQFAEVEQYEADILAANQRAEDAGSNGDQYVLTTVLLATALFFAGVTTSFKGMLPRIILVVGASLVIAYSAARIADLPVA